MGDTALHRQRERNPIIMLLAFATDYRRVQFHCRGCRRAAWRQGTRGEGTTGQEALLADARGLQTPSLPPTPCPPANPPPHLSSHRPVPRSAASLPRLVCIPSTPITATETRSLS
jgi:hypothetical protein